MSKNTRMNPFFLECILVVLLYTLSSVVIVQGFVKAERMAQRAEQKTMGLSKVIEQIERLKASDHTMALPDAWYYNAEWEEVVEREARYVLVPHYEMTNAMGSSFYEGEMQFMHYPTEEIFLTMPFTAYPMRQGGGQ